MLFRSSDDFTTIHNHIDTISYGIVVQDNNPILLHLLNNGIASLRSDPEYEKIINKWIVVDNKDYWKKVVKPYINILIFIVSGSLIYITINYHINRLLKRQIDKKTKELSKANSELEKRLHQIEVEGYLRSRIIEFSPGGIVLFDSNFNITFINSYALSLAKIGQTPVGQNILNFPVMGEILKPLSTDILKEKFLLKNQTYQIGRASWRVRV